MKQLQLDRFGIAIILILVVAGSFYAGTYVGQKTEPAIERVDTLSNKETGKPEEVDFSPFWEAWNKINEKYVSTKDKPTDQEKVYGAIQGLAQAVGDPYTVFFPPVESKAFESEISGNFEGVGMEVGTRDGMITVIAPLKGSPAERAGVLSSDKIIEIDGESTQDMGLEEAITHIRGKKGTTVKLTLSRESKKEPFTISIVRDTINVPTIDTEMLSNGIFVLQLYSFSENSASLFRSALVEFRKSGSDKMILDLRGNPGGYLEAAVDMASWFVPGGKIVVQEVSGNNREDKMHRSKGHPQLLNGTIKLVILIDGGSASASEILAGALSEHGIGKMIGTKTYGKGSVQELFKITPDTSLKVTVARWLTPNGRSISEEGLVPDIEVKITAEDIEKGRDPQRDKAIELLLAQ